MASLPSDGAAAGAQLLFAGSFRRRASEDEGDEVRLSHPVKIRAVRVLRRGSGGPSISLDAGEAVAGLAAAASAPLSVAGTLAALHGQLAPITPATLDDEQDGEEDEEPPVLPFWVEVHGQQEQGPATGAAAGTQLLLPPTQVTPLHLHRGGGALNGSSSYNESDDLLLLPASSSDTAVTSLVVKGTYTAVTLAFYGSIVTGDDATGGGAASDPSSAAVLLPSAAGLCPIWRPRPRPPLALLTGAGGDTPSAMPPPLALLSSAGGGGGEDGAGSEDDAADPSSEEYRVSRAAVDAVAAAVRACVGAWDEGGTEEAREAAVAAVQTAVEALWSSEAGSPLEGGSVPLREAVAAWEAEAEAGATADDGGDGPSSVLSDLLQCCLSLLSYARPDVPSDGALSADEESRVAAKSGTAGLRLAAALCVSPVVGQAFLFGEGGGYALLSVLQNVFAPTRWKVLALQALWAAVQDPAFLAAFCDDGKAPDVSGGGQAGSGAAVVLSFYQELVLFLSRRHLSEEVTGLGRRLLVRCALREALERAVRLAGLAAERGLLDFRRGLLVGLADIQGRQEEAAAKEWGEGSKRKGHGAPAPSLVSLPSSSLPVRLALALGDVRKRLRQDTGESGGEPDDDLEGAVARLLGAYEYVKLLAAAAALALRAEGKDELQQQQPGVSPLRHEVGLSIRWLLARRGGRLMGLLRLETEAVDALAGLLDPLASSLLQGGWKAGRALPARLWADEYLRRLLRSGDKGEKEAALSGLAELAASGPEGRAAVCQEMLRRPAAEVASALKPSKASSSHLSLILTSLFAGDEEEEEEELGADADASCLLGRLLLSHGAALARLGSDKAVRQLLTPATVVEGKGAEGLAAWVGKALDGLRDSDAEDEARRRQQLRVALLLLLVLPPAHPTAAAPLVKRALSALLGLLPERASSVEESLAQLLGGTSSSSGSATKPLSLLRRGRSLASVASALLLWAGQLAPALAPETAASFLSPAIALYVRVAHCFSLLATAAAAEPAVLSRLCSRVAALLAPWMPGGARYLTPLSSDDGRTLTSNVLRAKVCLPLIKRGTPLEFLAVGRLLCAFLPPPLPLPYGADSPVEADREREARAGWARYLLMTSVVDDDEDEGKDNGHAATAEGEHDSRPGSSSSSSAALAARLCILLATSGLPAARRLAVDLVARILGVGPAPGRVVVGRMLHMLRAWTEEALALVMAGADAAAAAPAVDDAGRCWQRLEGLLAVLHELVVAPEGGSLASLLLLEKPETLSLLSSLLLLLPSPAAAPLLPRTLVPLLARLCDPHQLRDEHDLARPAGLIGRLATDPQAVSLACHDGVTATLRRTLPGVAYTVKRTVLRWGLADAAVLSAALSVLLSTGQLCGPRAMLGEVIVPLPPGASAKRRERGEREMLFSPASFYAKALAFLGDELARLADQLEAKYQFLLDVQHEGGASDGNKGSDGARPRLSPRLRARAAALRAVEAKACQTLHCLAQLLALPGITAALCPVGTKRPQRAWFVRESSKTRGQPPAPLPEMPALAQVADAIAGVEERSIVLASALTSDDNAACPLVNGAPLLSQTLAAGVVEAAPLLALPGYLEAARSLLSEVEDMRAALDTAAAAAAAAMASGEKKDDEPLPADLTEAYRETDAAAVAQFARAVDEWAAHHRPVNDLLAGPAGTVSAAAALSRAADPLGRLSPSLAASSFQWTLGSLPQLAAMLDACDKAAAAGSSNNDGTGGGSSRTKRGAGPASDASGGGGGKRARQEAAAVYQGYEAPGTPPLGEE